MSGVSEFDSRLTSRIEIATAAALASATSAPELQAALARPHHDQHAGEADDRGAPAPPAHLLAQDEGGDARPRTAAARRRWPWRRPAAASTRHRSPAPSRRCPWRCARNGRRCAWSAMASPAPRRSWAAATCRRPVTGADARLVCDALDLRRRAGGSLAAGRACGCSRTLDQPRVTRLLVGAGRERRRPVVLPRRSPGGGKLPLPHDRRGAGETMALEVASSVISGAPPWAQPRWCWAFYAVSMLPLADATAIAFSQPLFSVVVAALVLGEKVRWRRWSAAGHRLCRRADHGAAGRGQPAAGAARWWRSPMPPPSPFRSCW